MALDPSASLAMEPGDDAEASGAEAPTPDVSVPSGRHERRRRWLKILATFLTGQTLVQGINLLTGFLLLRWMSVEAYAQYSVANSFQSAINILIDLGFTGSVVALVGGRISDPRIVGSYIRCARVYRGRMFFAMVAISTIAFPLLVRPQPWPWEAKLLLWSAIVCNIFFDAWNVYGAPLLMHRRLASYYKAQSLPAALRLTAFFVTHLSSTLFGWVASWINAAMTIVGGFQLRRSSRALVQEPESHDPEIGIEMRRYLAPLWIGMIFYAVQGQITIALMTLFGKTTSIAQVAALGRLGILLTFASAFLTNVLLPLVAQSDRRDLPRRIGLVLLTQAGFGLLLVLTSIVFPDLLMFFLGPNYADLRSILLLATSMACVAVISGSVYQINAIRKWISFGYTAIQIGTVIFAQALFLLLHPFRTPQDALWFGITTYASALACHAVFLFRYLAAERRVRTA